MKLSKNSILKDDIRKKNRAKETCNLNYRLYWDELIFSCYNIKKYKINLQSI